ncbi:hypothetical protein HYPSUDRAFT_72989 [Hypholoma sublateritium FD-334 SS-4]|uniref:Uncharacterized protein n=1 Tax=Hypholoma sublateritium (strain FD-334 SS-4) TaxID=945553 RepID=A0A0D2N2L7_HYPSF|nr:hypothetical protein HYPSUDRAFT_72989 [Hypholoma sublateritium FD-334 SS-4]
MTTRKAYEGSRRKIVIAFDIGTTFSGVSYSVLEPGQVPTIKNVTRFPAQDRASGSYKIPSIIYYDSFGGARVVGAEATRDGIEIEARENGWVKAEWFKLHMSSAQSTIHPLPTGKRAVDVFSDYLRYLYICAAQYICDTHVGGHTLWKSIKGEVDYVLSHPNGWGGREQSMMRQAAFLAGLIVENDLSRLTFVSEGEAGLHFCISSGILKKSDMEDNQGFIVVDAGGGTIDISAYRQKPGDDASIFEEIAPSRCLFQGSVYVNVNAKKFLVDFLRHSRFADDVDHLVNVFDKSAKVRFKTDQDSQYIKFGGVHDNDVSLDIKFGQLKLNGHVVQIMTR